MSHRNNNIIVVATVSIFITIFLCCECTMENHIHNHGRLRSRSSSFIAPDNNEDEQRCHALCREYNCRREYVQIRAKYFLSCNIVDEYPCVRHSNGTFCEALIQQYSTSNRYYYRYSYPDSNRSCSYSECSVECAMILQQLKETWGCCFHEMAKVNQLENSIHNKGFTTKNHAFS